MKRLTEADLLRALRANRPAKASALAVALGVSQPTVSRHLRALGERLVVSGAGRRTRYALLRAVRGRAGPIPLFSIDESGRGHPVAKLACTAPEGSMLALDAPFPWPLPGLMREGWFDGLPYPVADMRPSGFLGRAFSRQHARTLGVPEDPDTWSDDDLVHALALAGVDLPGNLILGEAAYAGFLDLRQAGALPRLDETALASEYPRRAEQALADGRIESSLAGEFPKFAAARVGAGAGAGETVHVLVKFSGADEAPAVRRWSDLLVCEHLAGETLRARLGVAAATSRILRFAGRTFLEVERFDRHGDYGRSPACTLESIGAALLGAPLPWPAAAARLHAAGWLSVDDVHRVEKLHWFGRLIGNTDMHDGNLAFRPGLHVAPAYDMLPMLYAPLRGGEVAERRYSPPLPLPSEATVWGAAADAAQAFWLRCAADARISGAFRATCEANAARVAAAIASA